MSHAAIADAKPGANRPFSNPNPRKRGVALLCLVAAFISSIGALLFAVAWVRSLEGEAISRQRKTHNVSLVMYRGYAQFAVGELWSPQYPPPQGWTWDRISFVSAWPPRGTVLGFGYERVKQNQISYRNNGLVLYFPLWAPLLGATALSVFSIRAGIRHARLARSGHCPRCGYDLCATPNRCPECGHGTAESQNATSTS